MKRSSATHNILGTRGPRRVIHEIIEEDEQCKYPGWLEASHSLKEQMPEVKKEQFLAKTSTYAICSTHDTYKIEPNVSSIEPSSTMTSEQIIPNLMEGENRHRVAAKASYIMIEKKNPKEKIPSYDSMGTNTINTTKEHSKTMSKIKKIKASHGVRDSSEVKISEPFNLRDNFFSKLDTDSKDFLEIMPSARETKDKQTFKSVNLSEPNSPCFIQTMTINEIATEKASQGNTMIVQSRKGFKETSRNMDVSAESTYKPSVTGDKITIISSHGKKYSEFRMNDDSDEYFMAESFNNYDTGCLSAVTRRHPYLNIVDKVYLQFEEREKGTQTETKQTDDSKLLIESYSQTDKELNINSVSQQSENVSTVNQNDIATCTDHDRVVNAMTKFVDNSENTVITTENEVQSSEWDVEVYGQTESTMNTPHKISHEVQDTKLNEEMNASNEYIWNYLKTSFTLFLSLRRYMSATSTQTEKDESTTDVPEITKNPWQILKEYIAFPFMTEGEGTSDEKTGTGISQNQHDDEVGGAVRPPPSSADSDPTPLRDMTTPPQAPQYSNTQGPLGDELARPYQRRRRSSPVKHLPKQDWTHRRPPPREHQKPKEHILKPKWTKGGQMNLFPLDAPIRPRTNDVGVQTVDDPEDPNRVVICTCEKFIETEIIKGTGMFADGRRRIDYVLVMSNKRDRPRVEAIKLDFLTGLVKAGFYLEAEEGKLHKDLLFIKMNASDTTLDMYSKAFGVRRYFIDSHEEMINVSWWKECIFLRLFRFYEERDWIASMRYWYKRPLRLSNYDRSYVVYMMLQYFSFGQNKNYFGIDRLKRNKIILDSFALHNGPYQREQHTGNFNGRQVLYTNWAGVLNILWLQPLHLIHEYFGPKVGFFFTFYEFYNKTLLVAGLWGLFMLKVYYLQDLYGVYMMALRNHTCHRIDIRNVTEISTIVEKPNVRFFYLWSTLLCAECEGSSELDICPYTVTNDLCFDLKLMKFFDNQYIMAHSAGIVFLGFWFLAFWKQVEKYWKYVLELETSENCGTHLIRPQYTPPHWPSRLAQLLTGGLALVLPLLILVVPWLVIWLVFVEGYERARSWSVTLQDDTSGPPRVLLVIPIVNKVREYSMLFASAAVTQLLFYIIEKLLHWLAHFITTKCENHKTYEQLEKSYVYCMFWISFNYTAHLVVFFAWLKGSFYSTPIAYWDVVLNLTLPVLGSQLSLNLTALFPGRAATLLRRAVTLNCHPFSCFRQAVVVYVAVLCCRVVLVRVLHCLFTRIKAFIIGMKATCRSKLKTLPTVEREYMLQATSETELMRSFNTIVSQMALVFLFTPVFPQAPLIAFIVNIWDMRNKAHLLVVYHRRMIFHKAVGIGAWNHIIKIICYSIPLCHCLTVIRTNAFMIYLFHKVYSREFVPEVWAFGSYILNEVNMHTAWWFIKFSYFSNYIIGQAMSGHPRFAMMNVDRVTAANWDDDPIAKVMYKTTEFNAVVYRCRVHGFFAGEKTSEQSEASPAWPYRWNFVEENETKIWPEPHHYEWMFYKTIYMLMFSIISALIALCVRRYLSPYTSEVWRRLLRERTLLRLRLARAEPRPRRVRLRETHLLNEYENENRGANN